MSWRCAVQLNVGRLQLNVDIDGGDQTVALVGPNGSGKTTILRAIAGAFAPQHGSISVGNRVLFDSKTDVDLPPEQRHVGYVPQGHGLFPHLSALDNVAFGYSAASDRAATLARAQVMLEQLGCGDLTDSRPQQLSGGESQRVALARALMLAPEILLLDEPLAALDIAARRALRRFLADQLREAGRPVIVVTHDVRDVIALDADIVVLEAGKIVQRGSISALRSAPATEFVEEFVAVRTSPPGRDATP